MTLPAVVPAVVPAIVPALAAGVGVAVAVLLGSRRRVRLARPGGEILSRAPTDDVGMLRRLRIPLSGLAFVGGWAFVGGLLGVAAGLAVATISWRVLGRTESPAVRRRRERLARELPVGVQLLGSCLAAGAAIGPAFQVVADALPGPLGDELRRLHHRLELGVDPRVVWRELGAHPQLAALGRTLGRAHETGVSVATGIEALAGELRARARTQVEERARSVDVRAAAPLGACFLPAFLLLGVVPLVVGIFSSMQLFR
jgi:Flp pilus assembly protein TadB